MLASKTYKSAQRCRRHWQRQMVAYEAKRDSNPTPCEVTVCTLETVGVRLVVAA
jgi:hypothetical protein